MVAPALQEWELLAGGFVRARFCQILHDQTRANNAVQVMGQGAGKARNGEKRKLGVRFPKPPPIDPRLAANIAGNADRADFTLPIDPYLLR